MVRVGVTVAYVELAPTRRIDPDPWYWDGSPFHEVTFAELERELEELRREEAREVLAALASTIEAIEADERRFEAVIAATSERGFPVVRRDGGGP